MCVITCESMHSVAFYLQHKCVCVCVCVCVQFSATPEMNYSVTVSLVSGVGLGELSDLDKSRRPACG